MTASSILASPAARITLVISCLFAAAGVVMPYLSRWLSIERGLSGAEIGAVFSLAQIARIGMGPMIAFWADGVHDRRTPIRMMITVGVGAYAAFFLLAHDFWSVLICGFVALTATQGLLPFAEAAVLRATQTGTLPYGVARGIGSLCFIVANIVGGALIARFGLGAVIVWVLSAYMATASSAWGALKPDPAPESARSATARARLSAGAALLRNRRFVILIFACGLIQAGHAFYYAFSTLVWRGQGVSPEAVGVLWAFGTGMEVIFLWSLQPIERRVAPETLILFGAIGGVLRWTAMGFAPTGLLLWPLQALHALTFASAHIGAMRLIFREAPETSHGLAQTLYAALSGGLLLGLATLASGVLYDHVGARGYWLMAVMVAAGGVLALQLHGERHKRELSPNTGT